MADQGQVLQELHGCEVLWYNIVPAQDVKKAGECVAGAV